MTIQMYRCPLRINLSLAASSYATIVLRELHCKHQNVIRTRHLNSSISSKNFSRKRDIKELEINDQENRKHVKVGDSLISKPLNIDFAE
ncbi:14223_t:CDS:2 [Funneliformis caledonium]|uniref:14223_t:CDS:1 n=1 Tax=Funneliformis caledonium TaxID=1117310 RepID=A0A9N8W4S8_9GLOM|nr:14223_t:CDS:2 [Funneliformis caledonium]